MSKKIIAGVLSIAFVLAAVGAVSAPAQALTQAEATAIITALGLTGTQAATIQALVTGGSSSATGGYTYTRDLTLGSTGADVTALQNMLISNGRSIPAGATGYFGAQTQSALASWQASVGISPASGYFGPITRAKVNATVGTGTGTGTGTTGLSGGEASLEDYNAKDGDDDEVSEGETASVAEFEFDVEDGDVRIDRVDLTFTTGAAGAEEDEPWNTFDTITLYVNGNEVASEDVSDEDDWAENDSPFEFRFNDLDNADSIVREGEQAVITVEVETAGSIDSSSTDIDWTVYVQDEGIRAIDAEGIDQYTGETTNESVTFTISEEGSDEELSISSSTEDPDARVLEVDEDSTSDWFTLFAFELDAEENDIEIDQVGIDLTGSDSAITSVVNDAKLVIDGEEFDDYTFTSLGQFGSTTFDVDNEFTIPEGETVTVEYMVEFKAQSGNYATGTTISASTTASGITGEGADDVTAEGSAQGDTHTLQIAGISVAPIEDDFTAEVEIVEGSDNDYGEFEIVVDITSVGEEDIYISQTAATAYTFQLENASTGAVIATSTATTTTISTNADTEGSSYRIGSGDTETFTFTVTVNPLTTDEGKSFRLQLLTINFGESASDPAVSSWTATPAGDYETTGKLIND